MLLLPQRRLSQLRVLPRLGSRFSCTNFCCIYCLLSHLGDPYFSTLCCLGSSCCLLSYLRIELLQLFLGQLLAGLGSSGTSGGERRLRLVRSGNSEQVEESAAAAVSAAAVSTTLAAKALGTPNSTILRSSSQPDSVTTGTNKRKIAESASMEGRRLKLKRTTATTSLPTVPPKKVATAGQAEQLQQQQRQKEQREIQNGEDAIRQHQDDQVSLELRRLTARLQQLEKEYASEFLQAAQLPAWSWSAEELRRPLLERWRAYVDSVQ